MNYQQRYTKDIKINNKRETSGLIFYKSQL